MVAMNAPESGWVTIAAYPNIRGCPQSMDTVRA